ncbi:MAG TPA: hypothetical protein VM658_20460 [bacterium]|nr:hypothetical protein [bacterium]
MFLCLAIALAAGWYAHYRALRVGFLADDFEFWSCSDSFSRALGEFGLLGNRFIRPVPAIFWRLDRLLYGANAWGFHLTNLLIHCLNIILLFRLLEAAGLTRPASGAGAAILAAHPVGVGAVAWTAARFDLLCLCFSLLSLLCFVRRRYAASAGLFLLALLCKEMAITVPAAALVLYWSSPRGAGRRQWLKPLLALPGVAVAYLLLRIILLHGLGGYSAHGGLMFMDQGLRGLAATWIASVPENFVTRFAAGWPLALLAVAGAINPGTRARTLAAAALAWITILPVAHLLPHDTAVMNDRMLLFPTAAVAATAACAVSEKGLWRWASTGLAAAAAVMLALEAPAHYGPWLAATEKTRLIEEELALKVPLIHPGSRALVRSVPARQGDVLMMSNGFKDYFISRHAGSWPGKPPRMDLELTGLNIADAGPGRSLDQFDLVLAWDDLNGSFRDQTAKVKEWRRRRQELIESGIKLRPVEIEAENGPHLLRPASGTEGQDGTFALLPQGYLLSQGMRIEAWAVGRLRIRMSIEPAAPSGPASGYAQLYWRGEKTQRFCEAAKIIFSIQADGKEHEYLLQVQNNLAWLETGVIQELRLDPAAFPARVKISLLEIIPLTD